MDLEHEFENIRFSIQHLITLQNIERLVSYVRFNTSERPKTRFGTWVVLNLLERQNPHEIKEQHFFLRPIKNEVVKYFI